MPRSSATENVRKLCDCTKWKTCACPWYVDYQEDTRRYRRNLDKVIGRHCADFATAKVEARRAIVAWLDGRDPRGLLPSDDPTLAEILQAYDRERPRADRWQVGRILQTPMHGRPFGDWRANTITAETLKAFRRQRPLVAGNRDLNLLRAACNWAVLGGLLPSSPFRIGGVPAVRLGREEARTRRLQPGEYERLLTAAGRLEALVAAAVETGCRKGELLSLQWYQVRFSPRAELYLTSGKTKTKRDRRIPISSVLLEVLLRRRQDPAGETLPPEAYVFGDEIGRRRTSIKTAWTATLRRAKITGLHFHDLRREAGSRWMDAGIPLATIQRWLGHANISQTSTYLGASLGGDEQDMRAYEAAIGRRAPLTQIDVFDRLNGREPAASDTAPSQKTEQNAIVH